MSKTIVLFSCLFRDDYFFFICIIGMFVLSRLVSSPFGLEKLESSVWKEKKKAILGHFSRVFPGSDLLIQCVSTTAHSLSNQTFGVFQKNVPILKTPEFGESMSKLEKYEIFVFS